MKTQFETKEQYLNFRAAWKKAVNDERAKTTVHDGNRQNGWIHGLHSMIFNIMCDKPFHTGFTPITSVRKLKGGAYINRGLYNAAIDLDVLITCCKCYIAEDEKALRPWNMERMIKQLLPFDGTITPAMIAKLEPLNIKPLEPGYGRGKQVFTKLILPIEGEATPITRSIPVITFPQIFEFEGAA